MKYRPRESKAVSAWIRDQRGAFTHGGETACPGFHLYRGFVGCPAWAAGQPCSYCFLKTTFNGGRDTDLRKGVCWLGDCVLCHGSGKRFPTISNSIPCDNCGGTGIGGDYCGKATPWTAANAWLNRSACAVCGAWHRDLQSHQSRHPGEDWKTVRWCAHCRRSTELRPTAPMLLNAGELGDSLAFSPDENPHVGMLLDLFSDEATNPHGQKLLLLTKAGLEATQAHLQGRTPSENVILSWSIGNLDMEPYWGDPIQRAAAAGQCADLGWRVRLRLDPLDSEENHNVDLDPRQHAAENVLPSWPELITLGTLRHRGGRPKLPAEERVSIYFGAIAGLREGGYEGPVGLCKETPDIIHTVLGIQAHEMRCNCTP